MNRCAVVVIKDTDLSLTLCVLKSLTTPPDVLKSACLEVQSKSDANVLTEWRIPDRNFLTLSMSTSKTSTYSRHNKRLCTKSLFFTVCTPTAPLVKLITSRLDLLERETSKTIRRLTVINYFKGIIHPKLRILINLGCFSKPIWISSREQKKKEILKNVLVTFSHTKNGNWCCQAPKWQNTP